MNISDIHVGDHLVHRTNPLLSGPVVGVDLSGPVRPAGPCVWVDHIGRQHRPWLRVGETELAEYGVHPKDLESQKET